MVAKGYLAIILHAHLPFVRHPEYEESLEENWLFEAITETYIPLLLMMEGLVADDIDFRLTLSLSPTLTSMLLDPLLQSRYLKRLEGLLELAEKEVKRTSGKSRMNKLARMYLQRFQQVHHAYLHSYERDLVRAFRRFYDMGKIEIIVTAATHGYLPLLAPNPSSVRDQILVAAEHYHHLFGRRPEGFWLPECAYFEGLEKFLKDQGLKYTILETHGVTRADPRPRYGVYAPVISPNGVAVFGRDPESSKQVWSSKEGYPGDSAYREFYRDIGHDLDFEYIKPHIHRDGIRHDTGIKYYRITGDNVNKKLYDPEAARKKADHHADNFIHCRRQQIKSLSAIMDRKPIIVAPYDAELFGHWWFEGPSWLKAMIRKIVSSQETIELITLSEYLAKYPISQEASPSISSWGFNGYHEVWLNPSNDWIYPPLHRAAEELERLISSYSQLDDLGQRALNQARRELLLAQASDWPFMINAGTMAEYGTTRIKAHLASVFKLCKEIEEQEIDEQHLTNLEYRHNLFSYLQYA